jgi:UDP-N-acetylenolpyruvoylglucosamine reductase
MSTTLPDALTDADGPDDPFTTTGLDAPPTDPTRAALAELRTLLPGQVVVHGEPYWDLHRLGWVVNVDQQPHAVVTVADADDVVAVVRFARRHRLTVAAQPGGHGATSALTGTVVLRTRGLAGIEIDIASRTARVGAGVKFGELLAELDGTGLTALAGSTPDTTVVGLSLGGGLSWFGRAYGLAADSIVSLDLVDADGQLVRVTAASDPDLYWAVRGGGGDFGVVTAVEIRLHPAGHVYGGRLMWPIEAAPQVLRAYRDATATAPDELTLWAHLLRFPPLEVIPEPLRGGSFVTVDATYLGSAEDADALLAPLRALSPAMDTMGTVALSRLGDVLQEPVDPTPAMERSTLLRELSDDTLDALLGATGPESDSMLTIVQLRHLGGALARPAEQPGAVGVLDDPFQLFLLGIPAVPELVAPLQAALSSAESAVAPWASGRRLFNFLGSHEDPSAAFTPEALARLRRVKVSRDPHGVIRSNRPVLTGTGRVPAQGLARG